jgi:ankyrin repeat protein
LHRDAVQISTRNGSLDILKILFAAGASLTTRGKRGDTLFHLAAANGHVSIMEWLTSVGVMHNMVDLAGQTCAHVAARRGEVAVLRYLELKHDMDFNQKDFDDETPLEKIPKHPLHGNEKELEETRLFLLSRREREMSEES